ncbi:hypothetical protein SVAN01_00409 [Stagonosporopsis vannaccii]|nr:hypothetical protein SVAN01_00409 [Stagonosporopsis vannaccii]
MPSSSVLQTPVNSAHSFPQPFRASPSRTPHETPTVPAYPQCDIITRSEEAVQGSASAKTSLLENRNWIPSWCSLDGLAVKLGTDNKERLISPRMSPSVWEMQRAPFHRTCSARPARQGCRQTAVTAVRRAMWGKSHGGQARLAELDERASARSESHAVPGRSSRRFALCGRPDRASHRATQSRTDVCAELRSKSSRSSSTPCHGRPAQWTLSPLLRHAAEGRRNASTLLKLLDLVGWGNCGNFGPLKLVRWGAYEKGSGSFTGC